MTVSDFIPKYYKRTEDFQQLAYAYDTILQPLIDAIRQVYRNCRAPIHFSEYELRPLLAAAGYKEANNMSLEDMRELFVDILQNRRLMTDVAFVKQLRRVFDEDVWTLTINREHNISVTVDCDIEDVSKNIGDSHDVLIYDLLAANIMHSFPAGVRLKLNALMEDSHSCYIGVLPTVMIEFYCEVEPPSESLYRIIDMVTGEESQCGEPPSLALIDKGGTMFTSDRTLVNIEPNNNYPLVDKGGTMFTSNRTLETIPVEGIEIINLS